MCITHAYKPLLQNLFIKLVDHVVLRVTNYLVVSGEARFKHYLCVFEIEYVCCLH